MNNQKLTCQECGQEFPFSSGEQKFFEEKGFEPPKRCPDCRKKRKTSKPSKEEFKNTNTSAGEIHTIACAKCKKTSQVPFKPRSNDPIYCAECFEKSSK
jgi:CxxC-x17-CxxC domain-containing protein